VRERKAAFNQDNGHANYKNRQPVDDFGDNIGY
jgi:hypothetical protein